MALLPRCFLSLTPGGCCMCFFVFFFPSLFMSLSGQMSVFRPRISACCQNAIRILVIHRVGRGNVEVEEDEAHLRRGRERKVVHLEIFFCPFSLAADWKAYSCAVTLHCNGPVFFFFPASPPLLPLPSYCYCLYHSDVLKQ